MQATTTRPEITATADGKGVVSHAGSRLLADVADRTTLTAQLAEELVGLRKPRARHDPGRVLVDMAVAVADGATTISDVAVLADRAELFGAVASDSTCWRLLDRLDAVPRHPLRHLPIAFSVSFRGVDHGCVHQRRPAAP